MKPTEIIASMQIGVMVLFVIIIAYIYYKLTNIKIPDITKVVHEEIEREADIRVTQIEQKEGTYGWGVLDYSEDFGTAYYPSEYVQEEHLSTGVGTGGWI